VNRYHSGEVLIDISEQDIKKLFKRKFPGYFKDDSD
jgi:hypothetical protein